MITLGLDKLVSNLRAPSSTGLRQPLPAVLRALSETAAWCLSRSQHDQLRSRELYPAAFLVPPYTPPYDKAGFEVWLAAKRKSYQLAIQAINETRSTLLCDADVELVPVPQLKGKLLKYEPLENVEDGASESCSHGFFDLEDAPPWDTWFLYSGSTIFSWVPDSLVQRAQAGIDANPVDCIHWCDWCELAAPLDV